MDNLKGGLNKGGAKVILWLLIIAMFIYTVIRTIHFLQNTLPKDQQAVAYLALAAFDIGVLAWLYYATHSAEGVSQRVVAYGMIFVCCAGVLTCTIADTLIGAADNGFAKLPSGTHEVALWSVIIVIALNFFAGIIVHLVDPKHQKHMSVESARDRIHAASLAAIDQRAGEIAPQIAARVAEHWENQIIQEMIGFLPKPKDVAASLLASGPGNSNPVVVASEPVVSLAQTASAPVVLPPPSASAEADTVELVEPVEHTSDKKKAKVGRPKKKLPPMGGQGESTQTP